MSCALVYLSRDGGAVGTMGDPEGIAHADPDVACLAFVESDS